MGRAARRECSRAKVARRRALGSRTIEGREGERDRVWSKGSEEWGEMRVEERASEFFFFHARRFLSFVAYFFPPLFVPQQAVSVCFSLLLQKKAPFNSLSLRMFAFVSSQFFVHVSCFAVPAPLVSSSPAGDDDDEEEREGKERRKRGSKRTREEEEGSLSLPPPLSPSRLPQRPRPPLSPSPVVLVLLLRSKAARALSGNIDDGGGRNEEGEGGNGKSIKKLVFFFASGAPPCPTRPTLQY